MNRIERISAILIQLQTKRFVTAEEMADRFEISKRTIYRDLKAVEETGVPIGAEPGKGYFLIEGYHLPPVMFTPEEASALLTAEKLVEKLTDQSVSKHVQSAMFKIKSVLPEKDKQFLANLNANIEVLYSFKSDFSNNFLTDIHYAIAHKNTLLIDYKSLYKDELTSDREIEPVGLCFYSLGWHLIAFCRMRKEYRDFRIDRIAKLSINKSSSFQTKHLSIKQFFAQHATSENLQEVVLLFEKQVVPMLHSVKYYFGYIDELEVNGKVEMTFLISDLEYLSRWLLSYADVVDIISPDILKKRFSDLIFSIFEKNKKHC